LDRINRIDRIQGRKEGKAAHSPPEPFGTVFHVSFALLRAFAPSRLGVKECLFEIEKSKIRNIKSKDGKESALSIKYALEKA
jgi:hypothetical protein